MSGTEHNLLHFFYTLFPYHSLFPPFDENTLTAWCVVALTTYFTASAIVLWRKSTEISLVIQQVTQSFSVELIQDNALLREEWGQYARTFLSPVGERRKTDQEAESYFNEQSILAHHLDLRYWQALPGILLGLGILGTFVGLTFGIAGFDTTGREKIEQSIQTLLSGMGTAFVTSVWGMLLSILFGVLEKRWLKRVHMQIRALCRILDQQFRITKAEELRFATEDQVAVISAFASQMEETIQKLFRVEFSTTLSKLEETLHQFQQERNKDQTALFTRFFAFHTEEEQAVLPADILREVLHHIKKQAGIFTDLVQSIRSWPEILHVFGTQIGDTLQKVFQNELAPVLHSSLYKIGEEVHNSLSTATVSHLENLTQIIHTANETSGMMHQEVENTLHRFGTLIQSLPTTMRTMVDHHAQTIHALQGFLVHWDTLLQKSTEISEDMNTAIHTLHDTLQKLEKLSEHFMDTAHILQTSSDNLQTSLEQLTQQSQVFLTSNQHTLEQLGSLLTQTQEVASDFVHKFQIIQDGLGNVFSELQEGLSRYQETTRDSLNDYLAQFTEGFAQAVPPLLAGIQELGEVVEEILEIRRDLPPLHQPGRSEQ